MYHLKLPVRSDSIYSSDKRNHWKSCMQSQTTQVQALDIIPQGSTGYVGRLNMFNGNLLLLFNANLATVNKTKSDTPVLWLPVALNISNHQFVKQRNASANQNCSICTYTLDCPTPFYYFLCFSCPSITWNGSKGAGQLVNSGCHEKNRDSGARDTTQQGSLKHG